MFYAIRYLKCRLEAEAMEFYEKWDLVDTCGWIIPEDVSVEAFMADRAREDAEEAAAVRILQMLKATLDAVPAPIIERTEELCKSVGREEYDKTFCHIIETIGFGFDPADAAEFIEVLNESLSSTSPALDLNSAYFARSIKDKKFGRLDRLCNHHIDGSNKRNGRNDAPDQPSTAVAAIL